MLPCRVLVLLQQAAAAAPGKQPNFILQSRASDNAPFAQLVYDQQYVVQEYLTRPLLIGGFKFDLRLYVLVKSFHPLRCFCFHEGLVRFATEKYSRDQGSLHNLYAHLTNTSINKHSPSFSSIKDTVGAWQPGQLATVPASLHICIVTMHAHMYAHVCTCASWIRCGEQMAGFQTA